MRELLVDTPNPDALDLVLNAMGSALVGGGMSEGYERVQGHYVARCFDNAGYIRFAIEHQGYAQVIGWRDEIAPDSRTG